MGLRKGIAVHFLWKASSRSLHLAAPVPSSSEESLGVVERERMDVRFAVRRDSGADMEDEGVVSRGDRGSALSTCTVLPRG